ncbi:MAG: TonB-dependent receptor [Phenylobacterium sp.]|uniref:TonB-dependent receptor n=1 Tax=Phenylobacterium sp. TaxID=1871053 RepID=UPI0027368DB0|nr:TonB-dependent receptor [Phenylobacterium sp.]MDP3746476.1 TonB-dependent receptor [Phenylobacterium sp.]
MIERGPSSARTRRLRVWLLATAGLPLLALGAPASAQVASPAAAADQVQATVDEVVITGVRETIQTSISEKRTETAIVDAISSTEIGNLPATSIGEAIETITGATSHREKGGATEIAIRGLGSFLGATTFNGREASNGSGDRAVNFNQFPSELVNGIKIYKTQQASLVEGGVAGTIELETLKPLDYGRRRIQLDLKANYNPYQTRQHGDDGLGWRGTASYVDQFEVRGLGDVGVALGFQRNEVNNPEETYAASTTWVACNATVTVAGNCPEVSRQAASAGTPFFLAPNGITLRQIQENDRRDAFFGAVQWRPDDRWDINLDLQYSKRRFEEERSDLTLAETRAGLRERIVDPAGYLLHVEGISSIDAISALLRREETYLGAGLGVSYQASERLTVSADMSFSKTKRSDLQRTTRLRSDPLDIFGAPTPLANQRVPYIYDVRNGFAPTITIDPRFDVNDHALFSDDALLRRDESERNNEILAGRIDVDYDLDGFIEKLEAGVRFSRLTYDSFSDRVQLTQSDRAVDRDVNLACRTPFPQSDYLGDAPGANIRSWATFDLLCQFRSYLGVEDPGGNADQRSVDNADVKEDVWSAYVMASYRSELGSIPVYGNFGVRAVDTSVTSTGLRSALQVVTNPGGSIRLVEVGDFEKVVIETGSTRVLPSANLIFGLRENVLLRLAAYRAMSRPAPSNLGAGRSIQLEDGADFSSVEDAIRLISASGSPRLKPLMSWNADVSLEYYPNRDSILAAAVYYKRFTGGFMPVVLDESFNIGGDEVTIPVTQTRNSDRESRIYGLELTLATRFSWLPAPFDGFGGKLGYNYADSNFVTHDIRLGDVVDVVTGEVQSGMIPPANLSGYSKHVLSAQAYYQRGPFQIQGIYKFHSKYNLGFIAGEAQLRYVRDSETFDVLASYDVNRNLSFRAEALNIFNEPKITDMPVRGSVRQYHYYGAKYYLGLRYRF